jgi:hypothetical protein
MTNYRFKIQHIGKMNPAKLLQLFTFGLLFVAFALASNENSTNPNSNISNTYLLKAKREMSDAPTLLMYLAIGAIIVIPQIPQIDV